MFDWFKLKWVVIGFAILSLLGVLGCGTALTWSADTEDPTVTIGFRCDNALFFKVEGTKGTAEGAIAAEPVEPDAPIE